MMKPILAQGGTKGECVRKVIELEGRGYEPIHPIKETFKKVKRYNTAGRYIGDDHKTIFYTQMQKVEVKTDA